MRQVGKGRKGTDQGDREPIPRRFYSSHLITYVLRQMRQRIALSQPAFRCDVFVAAGKGDRLKSHERNLLGILHRKLHYGPDLIVIHVVNDRNHQNDLDAGLVHVLDGAQLHVKQISHLAVAIRVIPNSIELKVGIAQARLERFPAKLLALGKFDPIGGRLHAVIAELSRVADSVDEIGVHGGLATRKLHRKLAARLDFYRVVQNFLYFVPSQLVNVADLVCVHKARIAHHVATIGQIDRQDCAPAISNRAGSMLVQALIVMCGNIAAGEILLDPSQESRIDGHKVFVGAVNGTFLHHPDLAVAFDDLGLDFPDFLAHQVAPVLLPIENGLARFFDTPRAERISLPRPPQRWLRFLPGLQQRFIGPLRCKRRIRIEFVEKLQRIESHAGCFAHGQIDHFPGSRTWAYFPRHVNCLAFPQRCWSFPRFKKECSEVLISCPQRASRYYVTYAHEARLFPATSAPLSFSFAGRREGV